MTRTQVVEVVIHALQETQRMSGHAGELAISESTTPIGDLPEFDSHNGVEATVVIEERLGISLPINVFADEAGRQALSVGQVADRLLELGPVRET